MSTTPRTPQHFPRMKHRAAGRLIRKRRRQWRAMAVAAEPAARAIEEFARAVVIALEQWQTSWLAHALAMSDAIQEAERMSSSTTSNVSMPASCRDGNPTSGPRRVQQRRTKGWRKPENTVSVARPSKWGNPYPVDQFGREHAVIGFRAALIEGRLTRITIDDVRRELAGKNLMCFCALDEPCHADVLLEIANGE